MAQQFITDSGTLIVPGAYPSITVQNGAQGLSTTGVIALVGEADAGPDYTLETDLSSNFFGPDQLAAVVSKYKTGPLVDAFRGASVAANDPNIIGAPSSFVLVKTNPSTKSSATVLNNAAGTYATMKDLSYGALGNLLFYSVAQKTAEVRPTTNAFTFLVPIAQFDMSVRINGGTAITYSAAAGQLPSAFQSGLQGASASLSVTGGADRLVIQAIAGTLGTTATGNSVVFTISTTWAVTPVVGDTLFVSTTSVVKGGSNQNCGSYVITAATASTITATKLMDATGSVGTLTTPITVAPVSVASTTADLRCFSPVTITTSSATVVDGIGKTLEINELTSSTDRLSNCAYQLNSTKVTWVSKTGAATQLVSSAESAVTLNVSRQVDGVSESMSAGGQIALQLGYTGTTCVVTINATTLSTVVTGGAGANQSIVLANFPTLNDLVAFINTLPGYTAAIGSAAVGQLASVATDEGVFSAATNFGNATLRLKADAAKLALAVATGSQHITLTYPVGNVAGLPAVTSGSIFLAGGARAGTTDAVFQAAVDKLQGVQLNFLVPLFSQDASLDITAGITDSSSTYHIDSTNAYVRTHCNAMSTLKRKKNRQGFCSKRDTFLNVQTAAQNLASARISLCFQDVKDTGSNGIVQFQPWMAAAKAAGMQAAGFYRAIVNKGINISGALQATNDFDYRLDTDLETALLNGLCPIRAPAGGGFVWVSDQTTYLRDANFVFNSIQAMYAADTVALTTALRLQQAFVGQSVADVSATVALSALENIMSDMLRLKLIAKSDDAAKGFKNARIAISGPTMQVSVEIKLAGAIYFIPISFQVSQVTSTAGAAPASSSG